MRVSSRDAIPREISRSCGSYANDTSSGSIVVRSGPVVRRRFREDASEDPSRLASVRLDVGSTDDTSPTLEIGIDHASQILGSAWQRIQTLLE